MSPSRIWWLSAAAAAAASLAVLSLALTAVADQFPAVIGPDALGSGARRPPSAHDPEVRAHAARAAPQLTRCRGR
jgi:hypothetical protein